MIVTLGQQYNVEKKPVILGTYIVVTKRYQGQRVCDTGSLFLPSCMYVLSTLPAEYDMDQPGVVARTSSEEVKRRENDTFPVLVRARECRLARQVPRFRPASASWSFPLPYGIPPHTVQLVRRANRPCCCSSRVKCLRTGELENCAIHFNDFLGFNRPPLPAAAFRTAD